MGCAPAIGRHRCLCSALAHGMPGSPVTHDRAWTCAGSSMTCGGCSSTVSRGLRTTMSTGARCSCVTGRGSGMRGAVRPGRSCSSGSSTCTRKSHVAQERNGRHKEVISESANGADTSDTCEAADNASNYSARFL